MRLQFVLSEIAQGLRRNWTMAVSVALVTFISLTFVGAAALLQKQIGVLKGDWYDKVEVSIFMCPANSQEAQCIGGAATPEQIAAVEADLNAAGIAEYISSYEIETPAEAYANFLERFGDDSIYQEVTADQMPTSFRIKLVDPEQYQVIADAFTGKPGVDEVSDQRQILEPLFLLLNRATLLAVGLAVVMLLTSVLLINTTIRLSAISRRRETGIMRLVGASNLFIQLPFMLEGAIAATCGAALAVGGLFLGVRYVIQDWLSDSTKFVNYIGLDAVAEIAPWLFVIALATAAISSLVSLRKFTKV
jgi:cell division transport system permease protein